ncbi:hypothetical protein HMPREF9446_02025 [Bacteroides fluxus YIT 12057]|uniref:Uncharacterized protein n=1 Tax=Bacteroides fluxus YIT 12057 TaxID=763034 RepID=F3PTF7_9BACE|nr:hypothetical protein HMPREF9446_02025 [Bacteroides fluxus YIT 12057]
MTIFAKTPAFNYIFNFNSFFRTIHTPLSNAIYWNVTFTEG